MMNTERVCKRTVFEDIQASRFSNATIVTKGNPVPTLLNASDTTRFVFEIKGGNIDDTFVNVINSIDSRGKAMG